MTHVVTAYIGVGSNVGDREGFCRKAIDLLRKAGTVAAVSSFYETEPIGRTDQRDFMNAVAVVKTTLPPAGLLALCRTIEDRLGRKREERWGPRTADLDILLYGEEVIDGSDLTIPHPRMAERLFVLLPLAEVAPSAVHPLLGKTLERLAAEVRDRQRVIKRGPAPEWP